MYKIFTIFTTIQDGNLAYHVSHDKDQVTTNRQNLSLKYPIDSQNLVSMNQIHSDIVCTVDCGQTINTCDALITNKTYTPLMVLVADCIPILLYDNIKGLIACVHAGRAGTYNFIVVNTLNKMVNQYGSLKENIHVILGPSIHKCCYEVSQDLANEARSLFPHCFIDGRNLDLQGINIWQMTEYGVPLENIKDINICTKCNSDIYFSYRTNKDCGRFAGIIMIS